MELAFSTTTTTKNINYKNTLLLLQINFLIFYFYKFFFAYYSYYLQKKNKLTIIAIYALLFYNMLFLFKTNYQFSALISIKEFIIKINHKTKISNIIFPLLKSPFIYKKAVRHFAQIKNYHQTIYYSNVFLIKFLQTLNKNKLELYTVWQDIYINEKQFILFA